MSDALEPLLFRNATEWGAWLAANHDSAKEAWVIHQKAKSAGPGLRYADALNEALAYGWIIGIMRSKDKDSIIQSYTPRRPGSNWSESNKARMEKLISQGKITKAGLAAVEVAKKSGKW